MGLEQTDFVLPSGETMRMRGMTGYEISLAQKTRGGDSLAMNAFMLGLGMDADEKTAEQVGLGWMKAHLAGDFRAATEHLKTLSGLDEDAAKSSVDTARGEPG